MVVRRRRVYSLSLTLETNPKTENVYVMGLVNMYCMNGSGQSNSGTETHFFGIRTLGMAPKMIFNVIANQITESNTSVRIPFI